EENLSGKREDTFGASRFLTDQINHYRDVVGKLDAEISALKRDRNVGLHDRLVELQKKLDDQLVQYTESHPEVIKTRAEIDSLRAKFRTRKKQTDADGQEKQPVETGSSGMSSAENVKNQIAALERERESNKKIHEELAAAYGKSEVSSQAELQDKAGTFKIVDPAVLPIDPVSPNRLMIILLGVAGGLAGAFVVLFALDALNPSVKGIDEVRSFGVPVLAVIPHIESPEELIKTKRKDAYFYALSGLFVMLLGVVILSELIFKAR
ncbi:MAG TPA: GNVR domain-containing protein, partial [Nitrospirota bacterium]